MDASLSGVRIKMKTKDPLPTGFVLVIVDDDMQVECEIVWRKGLEVGARVLSSGPRDRSLACSYPWVDHVQP